MRFSCTTACALRGTLAVLPNLEVLESLVAWAPQGVYMRMLEEMMRTKQADQGKYNHHDH